MFSAVKGFSATKHKEREELGELITRWLESQSGKIKLVDKVVTQSSDNEYHCVTVVLFYDKLR